MAPLKSGQLKGAAALAGIAPGMVEGATGQFAVQFLNADGSVAPNPANVIPIWSSSDTTNAPVVVSADGMTASVTIPATATISSFTLTVGAVLKTSGVQLQASLTVPVGAGAVADPTGLGIVQTA